MDHSFSAGRADQAAGAGRYMEAAESSGQGDAQAFRAASQQSADVPQSSTSRFGVRTTQPFPTQAAAARQALNEAKPRSRRERLEYGGNLFVNQQGQHGYTGPEAGEPESFNPKRGNVEVPGNSVLTGDYHTHPYQGYDPDHPEKPYERNSEGFRYVHGFSTHDLNSNRYEAYGESHHTPEQRQMRFRTIYGVNAAAPEEMAYYVSTPDGGDYVNYPARPPSREESAAKDPLSREVKSEWGTVRPFPSNDEWSS